MTSPSSGCFGALQHLTTPRLGPLHLVEGVDMEALDVAVGVRDAWLQAFDQTVGAVATGQEQLEKPVTLSVQETRRLAEADARGDPDELLAVHVAWHPYPDRQFHAPQP